MGTPSEQAADHIEKNLFVGYAGRAEYEVVLKTDDATNYVLAAEKVNEEDVVGFFRKDNHFKVYNNKAYLQVPLSIEARSIVIRFDSETGIKELRSESGNANGATYDLSGRQVENPAKGVYIMNGKKLIK